MSLVVGPPKKKRITCKSKKDKGQTKRKEKEITKIEF